MDTPYLRRVEKRASIIFYIRSSCTCNENLWAKLHNNALKVQVLFIECTMFMEKDFFFFLYARERERKREITYTIIYIYTSLDLGCFQKFEIVDWHTSYERAGIWHSSDWLGIHEQMRTPRSPDGNFTIILRSTSNFTSSKFRQ